MLSWQHGHSEHLIAGREQTAVRRTAVRCARGYVRAPSFARTGPGRTGAASTGERGDERQQANRDAITPKGFELEAQRIGRLLRTDYAIGFVDIGGWDTHVNENGTLAANLDSLGRGLQALARELGNTWSSTAVVVVSEFGRTFRENGNRGTDHGHGSVYWIAGGALAGGRVVGRQQRIELATLFQDRDLPVLNDYRAIIGGLLQSMWGLSAAQLEEVFPAVTPQDLGLV